MSQQRVFITGGSSGLGRALAERYAKAGYRVCIGDVNAAAGNEFVALLQGQGVQAAFLPCDVTKETDLAAAAQWLETNWGGVDVVINNAGVAAAGGIADYELPDWEWILDINLLGVVRGCKVFTPLFRRQGGGRFINIASMAGLMNLPKMAPYNVSKAAVISLSETLAYELAADNIKVSVVCPSFFKTNLAQSLRSTDAHLAKLTTKLVTKAKHDAATIASKIYAEASRDRFLILTQSDGAFAYRVKQLAPFSLFARIVARESKRLLTPRKNTENV